MLLFDTKIEDLKNGQQFNLYDLTMLDVLDGNNPLHDDTVGSLCNKLSCVTIQMWHNQEILYKIRKMTKEEFVEKYSNDLYDLHKTIKRCCDLNYQRSLLMDAIDYKIVNMKNDEVV